MSNISSLLTSPALTKFIELVKTSPSLLIEELPESAKAALIALIDTSLNSLVLVITSGSDRLLDDISFFTQTELLDIPEEGALPNIDITGKRLEVLYTLSIKKRGILFCPIHALLQKTLSPEELLSSCLHLRLQQEIDFTFFQEKLVSIGYKRVAVAAGKGEYAVRGGIIDVFPSSAPAPFRIEFLGDVIETIRSYDPISQTSIEQTTTCLITPAYDITTTSSLWDYLPKNIYIVVEDLLHLEDKFIALKTVLPELSSFEDFLKEITKKPHLFFTKNPVEALSDVVLEKKRGRPFYTGKTPLQPLSFEMGSLPIQTHRWHHPFSSIENFFKEGALHSLHSFPLDLYFVCASEAEKQDLSRRIAEENIALPDKVTYIEGYLSDGFVVEDCLCTLFPMTEINHRRRTRRQKWRSSYHTSQEAFHELQSGDFAVHFQHGICKYLGTEKKTNHLGEESEFLILEYAEGGTLYVPATQAHLVSRYIGVHEETPKLNTLGSGKWLKTRALAEKSIAGYAQDLLRLQAERSLRGGFSYPKDSEEVLFFEEDFPFVPTEDQLLAIEAIKQDMMSEQAMDRLICGDVGYGKTEVAMRAAFKAVCDGKKQVAVLVPTTVLALQHYETFKERMASFQVHIAHISRLSTPKETKETLKKLASGEIDILIGTHRLISKDVQFKDLGLIIVDEEQRFGVRAKEHLKSRKIGVDALTLSATPIPRTLYMSLIGIREISVINTPPQDRLPIKTILAERDRNLIKNGLIHEFSRDGQVFFIHNRVETLSQVQEELAQLVPEARIVTAHGQMHADEIDHIFHLFKTGEIDLLISTTIVENGVDIPNANTIFIDRADQFGLAELYQIRGRVGRWNKPAYAYLLISPGKRLTEPSQKRLEALISTSGYGGGMKIALKDLEIRGSGDILGVQQSGQVSAIGFHLYCKLLKKATLALRHKAPPTFAETKIECAYSASLPEDYVNESSLRMEIYHRLGDATETAQIDDLMKELKDRFGKLPLQTLWLCHIARLRVYATLHGFSLLRFEKLTFTAEKGGKRHLFPLPRTQDPAIWESTVIESLKQLSPHKK